MTIEALRSIFAELLDLNSPVDWSAVRFRETPAWDSMAHMALVSDIEDRFDISLKTDEVVNMSSFDDAVAILSGYNALA